MEDRYNAPIVIRLRVEVVNRGSYISSSLTSNSETEEWEVENVTVSSKCTYFGDQSLTASSIHVADKNSVADIAA